MYFTQKFSKYVPVCLVMKIIVLKLKTKVIYGKQNPQNNPKKLEPEGQRSKFCGTRNRH